MASFKLTSLIMVALFLIHALMNSLAHARQAKVANSFETSEIFREDGVYSRKAKNDKKAREEQERSAERERVMKGDEEIMNLIHKDYGRKWSPKGKKKPPINNHV